jgi:hypothetical protein
MKQMWEAREGSHQSFKEGGGGIREG